MLPLLLAAAAAVGVGGTSTHPPDRRALIWLYDTEAATLAALANHTSAFTAVAPPMYSVAFAPNGSAVLTSIGAECSDAVHAALPDKELWAWVESPDSDNKTAEDAVMYELFARPEHFIAAAQAEAAKRNITGFQFDFEAPGQAVNANKSMWLVRSPLPEPSASPTPPLLLRCACSARLCCCSAALCRPRPL